MTLNCHRIRIDIKRGVEFEWKSNLNWILVRIYSIRNNSYVIGWVMSGGRVVDYVRHEPCFSCSSNLTIKLGLHMLWSHWNIYSDCNSHLDCTISADCDSRCIETFSMTWHLDIFLLFGITFISFLWHAHVWFLF